MRFKNSRKRAHKPPLRILKELDPYEKEAKERRLKKKLAKRKLEYNPPPNRWVSKLGPCDTWFSTGKEIRAPLKKRDRTPFLNNNAVPVSETVLTPDPKSRARFHKLGFYRKDNILCEVLEEKLKPAYNKACRLFRPYVPARGFGFALKLCVHFGFTRRRIRDLLRIGDLLRRGSTRTYKKSISAWIYKNFTAKQRRTVHMDFNIEDQDSISDLEIGDCDYSDWDDYTW